MRHILRLAFAFGAALLAFTTAGAAPVPKGAGQGNADRDFFPLVKGTKWNYKVGSAEVTVTVAGTEKLNGEECAQVETAVGGTVSSTELYAVRADGVYRVKIKDDKLDPPVKVLQFPIKADASWKLDSSVAGQP